MDTVWGRHHALLHVHSTLHLALHRHSSRMVERGTVWRPWVARLVARVWPLLPRPALPRCFASSKLLSPTNKPPPPLLHMPSPPSVASCPSHLRCHPTTQQLATSPPLVPLAPGVVPSHHVCTHALVPASVQSPPLDLTSAATSQALPPAVVPASVQPPPLPLTSAGTSQAQPLWADLVRSPYPYPCQCWHLPGAVPTPALNTIAASTPSQLVPLTGGAMSKQGRRISSTVPTPAPHQRCHLPGTFHTPAPSAPAASVQSLPTALTGAAISQRGGRISFAGTPLARSCCSCS